MSPDRWLVLAGMMVLMVTAGCGDEHEIALESNPVQAQEGLSSFCIQLVCAMQCSLWDTGENLSFDDAWNAQEAIDELGADCGISNTSVFCYYYTGCYD